MDLDNIYTAQDASMQLRLIGEKLDEIEAQKAKNTQNVMKTARDISGWYTSEQKMKAKELLSLKHEGEELFQYDPEYLNQGGWKGLFKQFTPAGGRVMKTDAGQAYYSDPANVDVEGVESVGEGLSKTIEETTKAGQKGIESVKNFFTEDKVVSSSQDFRDPFEVKTGLTDAGKVFAGVGASLNTYDLLKNWDDKSNLDKVFGIGKTALSWGALLNPALGIYALGTSLADMIWD